jgi:hypothetical protein
MAQLTDFADDALTDTILNERTVKWGTTAQRPSSNIAVDSWYIDTDTAEILQNTGTYASPTWTKVIGSGDVGLIFALG